MKNSTMVVGWIWATVWVAGCAFDYDNPAEDCDAPVCLNTISGKVLYEDGLPYRGSVRVCFDIQNGSAICKPQAASENGTFTLALLQDDLYAAFDFEHGDYLHLEILGDSENAKADHYLTYLTSYAPSPEEIGEGADFDSGTHYLYRKVGDEILYDSELGATLDGHSKSGVHLEIAAGELGDKDQTVEVCKFPLDQWRPPFLGSTQPNALFYLAPYFAPVKGTDDHHWIDIEIDPATVEGWDDSGAKGVMYMLGDFHDNAYLHCDIDNDGKLDEVTQAAFVVCDHNVAVSDGMIKTRVSRLGWMAIERTN